MRSPSDHLWVILDHHHQNIIWGNMVNEEWWVVHSTKTVYVVVFSSFICAIHVAVSVIVYVSMC